MSYSSLACSGYMEFPSVPESTSNPTKHYELRLPVLSIPESKEPKHWYLISGKSQI